MNQRLCSFLHISNTGMNYKAQESRRDVVIDCAVLLEEE